MISGRIYFISILSLLFCAQVFAQTPPTELALFEEIPMVVTPGKKLQKITESPASVYIITSEDIKQNSTINLWELLRQVPGMDVGTTTYGQGDVSLRGFANPATNKTVLLIDGRNVYLPMLGFLLWEMLPVQMEEIDRIEVVKGSVASLYGANANLGLINVITKKPDQIKGGKFSTFHGTRNTHGTSALYGQTKGDFSYKVSTGWKETDASQPRGRDALDTLKTNMYVDHKIDEDSTVALSGGYAQADNYLLVTTLLLDQQAYFGPLQQHMNYLKADYTNGDFAAKAHWTYNKSDFQTGKFQTEVGLHTLEGELRYNLTLAETHDISIGGGGRYDKVDATNILSIDDNYKTDQGIYNIFLQDDFRISDQFLLNGSVRTDNYAISGFNPAARLALIYTPNDEDLYRLATAYSFRNPTFTDLYLDLTVEPLAGVTAHVFGNKSLEPETYLSYEASYQGRKLDGRLRPFMDVYITKIMEFVNLINTGTGVFGLDQSFINNGRAYSVGTELGAEYDLNKHVTLIGNYAFNYVNFINTSDHYPAPKHKINSGVKLKFLEDKLSTKFMVHYVGSTKSTISGSHGKVPQYVLGNVWVGYKIRQDLEASILGYNIFHDKHIQTFGGDEMDTRIIGKFEYSF